VDKLPECSDCFLKWNCAGECGALAMFLYENIFFVPKEKCVANKILGLNRIKKIIIDKVKKNIQPSKITNS
jgi:hypothetical protein